MGCVSAAEEVDEDCRVKESLACDQIYKDGRTSDLLCECSEQRSASQGSAAAVLSDPSNLQLVWSDEFDGDHVDGNKWSLHHGGGGFGNRELQYYRPQSAQVAKGIELRCARECPRARALGQRSGCCRQRIHMADGRGVGRSISWSLLVARQAKSSARSTPMLSTTWSTRRSPT